MGSPHKGGVQIKEKGNEDREIFLTPEEVFKLPEEVREAIANRVPNNWTVIKSLVLDLLFMGVTKTKAEIQQYAKETWHKPYTPWYVLPGYFKLYGIETEYIREIKNHVDVSYYKLKGVRIKESELKALLNQKK